MHSRRTKCEGVRFEEKMAGTLRRASQASGLSRRKLELSRSDAAYSGCAIRGSVWRGITENKIRQFSPLYLKPPYLFSSCRVCRTLKPVCVCLNKTSLGCSTVDSSLLESRRQEFVLGPAGASLASRTHCHLRRGAAFSSDLILGTSDA